MCPMIDFYYHVSHLNSKELRNYVIQNSHIHMHIAHQSMFCSWMCVCACHNIKFWLKEYVFKPKMKSVFFHFIYSHVFLSTKKKIEKNLFLQNRCLFPSVTVHAKNSRRKENLGRTLTLISIYFNFLFIFFFFIVEN